MSIEAMKQALAKFESLWEIGIDAVYRVELLPEIQALRQAIEQAEQIEPEDWRHYRHFHEQAEKQKTEEFVSWSKEKEFFDAAHAPPRKEWVGLDDEDWMNVPDFQKEGCELDAAIYDWIEARLKEKNT